MSSDDPSSLNWKDHGVIRSVKDQGSCVSCWALGTVANAQSVLIINGLYGINVDLSEQYFVKCTYSSDCDGTYHVKYVMDELLEGAPTKEQYPYFP